MKLTAILLLFTIAILTIPAAGFSADDEIVRTYPDGSYGMDIGGGYQVAPVGPDGREEVLMPEQYRQDYEDSRFGPMMKEGFLMFPDFKFSDAPKREAQPKAKEKEEREIKEQIFHQATTSTGGGSWGVYIPPSKEAPTQD